MNCYNSYGSKTCLNLFRFNMIRIVTIYSILKHVWTCWNMSKLFQIQYDTNCYNSCDSQTCLNMFKHDWTCSDSNTIWIVTIHVIVKHVWTCWNMSELVQIQYDMNCHDSCDSQTCLNLFRFNMIRIVTIHVILKHVWTRWNMSKLVQIQYDMNCYNSYDSQTCLNMFKHV